MRSKWILAALGLGVVIGFGAGTVSAMKGDHDGTLRLDPVDEVIGRFGRVRVDDAGDAFAIVRLDPGAPPLRLLIKGGRGMVASGVIADGDEVLVSGRNDKKPKHGYLGHVTLLK